LYTVDGGPDVLSVEVALYRGLDVHLMM